MLKYTLFFIMFWFLVGCNQDSSTEPSVGHDPALVGTWNIVTATVNGRSITPDSLEAIPVKLILNANGSGAYWLEDYGFPSENDTLNWSTSGNQITFADAFTGTYLVSGNTFTLSYSDTSGLRTIVFSKGTGGGTNNPSLVGTWNLVTIKINNQPVDPNTIEEVPAKIRLEADGSGTVWLEDYGNLAQVDTFTWSASGNQFTILNDVTANFTLVGNTFTMSYQESGTQIELTYIKQTGITKLHPDFYRYLCSIKSEKLNI